MSDQSSNLINLQLLENEFNLLLDQYQQVSNTYFSLNETTPTYVLLQGREIIGGDVISYQTIPTINSCQALCSSNSNCSGANYDTKTDMCIIKSGNITLGNTSNTNNYGIVSQKKNLLIQLNSINDSLYNILNQTAVLISNMSLSSDTHTTETDKLLIKTDLLTQNKLQIDTLIDENNNLDNVLKTSNMMVEKSNLSYFFWSMGVIILIIIIIKLY